ncbi:MAG: SusC/RagA family TonB-linked outer membrane protein [Flavobacteriaceae bacterium]|nr:MAG: SusC/RagA family TonB-linked outer membrane protein [Flavobacteriaceae bacterium]
MNKIKILLCLVFCSCALYAQNTVTGTIIFSEDGQPSPGVSVLVKGTEIGVVSDFDGKYAVKVSKKGVLTFSYVGYKTQEIAVANRSVIDVVLESDVASLEEVVIVGYGSQRKSDLTGAISSVKMSDVEKRQVSTIDQALQGQMAGVDVVVNSGTPGGGISINVRGLGSVNGSTPLYVVDGMIVDGIDYINSNDIENISVLKDASASAIYGSKGSGGVVLIKTKTGRKSNQAKVTVDTYSGVQNFWRAAPLLDSKHWAMLRNEAMLAANQSADPRLSNIETLPNTNWFKEISNEDAAISNYNFSISGGGEKSTYFVSAGYFKQEGIVKKTDFERISFRLNSTHQAKDWLKFGENIALVKTKNRTILEEEEWNNILVSAMNMDPITSVRNEDGSFSAAMFNDIKNPVAEIFYTNDSYKNYKTLANAFAEVTLLKGISFKSNLSISYAFGVNDSYNPIYFVSNTQKNDVSRIAKDNDSSFSSQWTNIVNYKGEFDKHKISALAGYELLNSRYNFGGVNVNGVPDDNDLRFISNASGRNKALVYGSTYQEKQMSYIGRVNYSFDNKYLLTANFRADASSKFTKKHQWGYFPSFSAGWKLSEEQFLSDVDFISSLKLRAGWGQIGDQNNLPAYQTVTTATTGNNYSWGNVLIPGIAFQTSGNDELKWATIITSNIGLDFELLNYKLTGTMEYYTKVTSDMLLAVPVPAQSGLQEAPWQNAGEVKNSGFEFSLGYKDNDNDFKYGVNLIFATVKNEVVSLGKGSEFIDSGLFRENFYALRTVVGQPMARFYGLKTDGLFQNQAEIDAQTAQTGVSPGDVRYVDADNDGNLDMQFLGNALPDFTYSLNTNFEYKGFDLSVMLQGVKGNKIFNGTSYYNRSSSAYWNLNVDMLNRWTVEGSQTSALYPRMNATDSNNSQMSDRFIEDGSYLRVKTLQLGYSLSKDLTNKMNISDLRVYFNAQNLFTFTKYKGLDPEIGQGMEGPLDIGVDRAFYPQARLLSLGLNLTF